MAGNKFEAGLEEAFQPASGILFHANRFSHEVHVKVGDFLDQGQHDFTLAVKVIVHSAFGKTGRLGNVIYIGSMVAILGKFGRGRFQQLSSRSVEHFSPFFFFISCHLPTL